MSEAGPVLHHGLYIRMIPDHYQGRQVSSEDLRGLLAQDGGPVGPLTLLCPLSLAVGLWGLPRNLATSDTDGEDLHVRMTVLTWRLSLADLSFRGGGLRSWQGGDVDLIIRVCLRRLTLHHYLVPAGHHCTCRALSRSLGSSTLIYLHHFAENRQS